MGKLYELLAAEKTAVATANQMADDTRTKFSKAESYFRGETKTLKMLAESPENDSLEKAAMVKKELSTTVPLTVDYFLQFWAKAENVMASKNASNQNAKADLVVRGNTVATSVPVDELMGLENRLGKLRALLSTMPTLDASRSWQPDSNNIEGAWVTDETHVSKTEKVMTPVVLAPATDKHPAQVKEASKDVVVGTFTTKIWSGAVSAAEKAKVLELLDEMIVACHQARNRANDIEAIDSKIGNAIADLIMEQFGTVTNVRG
jgi:hypothetical protein